MTTSSALKSAALALTALLSLSASGHAQTAMPGLSQKPLQIPGQPGKELGRIGKLKTLPGCFIRTNCTGGQRPNGRDPDATPKTPTCERVFVTFSSMDANGMSHERCLE